MIDIQNLIKTLPDRKLFEIDSLSINENDKIALIGENGTGGQWYNDDRYNKSIKIKV